jgi:hypothetical protein
MSVSRIVLLLEWNCIPHKYPIKIPIFGHSLFWEKPGFPYNPGVGSRREQVFFMEELDILGV